MVLTSKADKQLHRYQKYSLFDQTLSGSALEQVKRNVLILSEALVHLVYDFNSAGKGSEITYLVHNEQLISQEYLTQLTAFLASNPRAPHMLQRDSTLSKEFQRLLAQNIQSGVKRIGVQIREIQFFEEAKLSNKIQFYLVTSKLQELYVFLGVVGYLVALYLGLQKLAGDKIQAKKDKSQ